MQNIPLLLKPLAFIKCVHKKARSVFMTEYILTEGFKQSLSLSLLSLWSQGVKLVVRKYCIWHSDSCQAMVGK